MSPYIRHSIAVYTSHCIRDSVSQYIAVYTSRRSSRIDRGGEKFNRQQFTAPSARNRRDERAACGRNGRDERAGYVPNRRDERANYMRNGRDEREDYRRNGRDEREDYRRNGRDVRTTDLPPSSCCLLIAADASKNVAG